MPSSTDSPRRVSEVWVIDRLPALVLLLIPTTALALLLTLPSLSSTRIQTWPWAAGAALLWSIPLVVTLVRLARCARDSRLGGLLDSAFATLALSGLVATALSPLRDTLAPHLLPFLGALSLPYALLPLRRSPHADHFVAAFIYPTLASSALLWLNAQQNLPFGPFGRNDAPFGHANTTGAVCSLAGCWLALLSTRAPSRSVRLLHAGGALFAFVLAASSSSRGAVLAIAFAATVAGGILLLRRGRLLPFLALAALALSAALLSNQRLRELAFSGAWSADASESNAQRVAMIRGGFALAAERPFLGWGPGAVPHVFPSVRAALPGEPDNYLQLHNTPAQVAATLGLAGLAAAALLLAALALRIRSALRETPSRAEPVLLAATLSCGAALLLFDHSFATPAFALLAALPVAALALRSPSASTPPARPSVIVRWSVVVPAALVAAGLLPAVVRDLAARASWSAALDAVNASDPAAYAAALRRAIDRAPAEPFYADQLASHLATGHPFAGLAAPDRSAAIPVLQTSLARNPALESPHYNLGWLLLPIDPAAAREHFTAAAGLARSRAETYLGLALARIQLPDTTPAASVATALAAEILADPAFAWSARWSDPLLAEHRPAALAHAIAFLDARRLAPEFAAVLRSPGEPVKALGAYRRVRPGHGVLFGHPDGPPPADVNVLLRLDLPEDLLAQLPPRGFLPAPLLQACAGLAP